MQPPSRRVCFSFVKYKPSFSPHLGKRCWKRSCSGFDSLFDPFALFLMAAVYVGNYHRFKQQSADETFVFWYWFSSQNICFQCNVVKFPYGNVWIKRSSIKFGKSRDGRLDWRFDLCNHSFIDGWMIMSWVWHARSWKKSRGILFIPKFPDSKLLEALARRAA